MFLFKIFKNYKKVTFRPCVHIMSLLLPKIFKKEISINVKIQLQNMNICLIKQKKWHLRQDRKMFNRDKRLLDFTGPSQAKEDIGNGEHNFIIKKQIYSL